MRWGMGRERRMCTAVCTMDSLCLSLTLRSREPGSGRLTQSVFTIYFIQIISSIYTHCYTHTHTYKKKPFATARISLSRCFILCLPATNNSSPILFCIISPIITASAAFGTRTGRPVPVLSWWRENTMLDDSSTMVADRKLRNILHLDKLERQHIQSLYTCRASNNNVTAPISSAVTINLNRKYLM